MIGTLWKVQVTQVSQKMDDFQPPNRLLWHLSSSSELLKEQHFSLAICQRVHNPTSGEKMDKTTNTRKSVCVVFWKTCVFLVGAFGRARGPGCFLRMCMVKYTYIYVDSFIHMYIYIYVYVLYVNDYSFHIQWIDEPSLSGPTNFIGFLSIWFSHTHTKWGAHEKKPAKVDIANNSPIVEHYPSIIPSSLTASKNPRSLVSSWKGAHQFKETWGNCHSECHLEKNHLEFKCHIASEFLFKLPYKNWFNQPQE